MNKAILVQGGDGTAIPSNMVGEVKKVSSNSAITSATGYSSLGSVTLSPGTWLLSAMLACDFNTDPTPSISLSDNGFATHAGLTGYASTYMSVTKRSDAYYGATIATLPYTTTGTPTVHFVLNRSATSNSTFSAINLVAIRIA
jgi:hypothetical protein